VTDIVYGRNAVREALRGRRAVHEVLASERAAGLEWLRGPTVRVVSAARLEQVAGTPDHQGLVALVDPYPYADADDLIASPRPLVVALDEVTDPRNLGAVARAAEGAGADGIVIPRHRSASVTAAVCRASAGAVEHLPVAIVTNLADWIISARRPSLWAYAAEVAGTPHHRVDLSDGAIIVIGSEGRGVRPRVKSACDGTIGVPLHGHVESLNAATAAGVILFEAARQRDISV
jgi:23S rRNA (guanosine2251-2'-O)-methyltransferase